MDKGKNVQTELTVEELRRKIERVTREIQKIKEEGLKVDMTTAIYKATVTTLDEDLASQMKRKKEVEMETERLRKRLNLLRLEIHEGKAREAKIDIETAVLLAEVRCSTRNWRPAATQRAENTSPVIREQETKAPAVK